MRKLRRLVMLVMFGMSALVVIDNAKSLEEAGTGPEMAIAMAAAGSVSTGD